MKLIEILKKYFCCSYCFNNEKELLLKENKNNSSLLNDTDIFMDEIYKNNKELNQN